MRRHPGNDFAQRETAPRRTALSVSRQTRRPGERLGDRGKPASISVRSCVGETEASQTENNERGVPLHQRRRKDREATQRLVSHVGDEDVRVREQPMENLQNSVGLQIQDDAPLALVQQGEVAHSSLRRMGSRLRVNSLPGGSTLITSAPSSANSIAQ